MIDQSKNIVLGHKTNYLIVKDDVGRAKPSTRSLPSMGFTYGKSDLSNQEGAGEVTTSWKFHTAKQSSDDNNPRDFKKLNKRAILDGMITAKDNYKYRKTHDNRIPFGLDALKSRGLSLPNETFTYGRRNRP